MDQWEYLGIHFGYPECCRKTFNTMVGAVDNQLGGMASAGTGFIPCPEHAQQILAGEIKIEDLIIDRQHSVPFPECNDNEALESYYESL